MVKIALLNSVIMNSYHPLLSAIFQNTVAFEWILRNQLKCILILLGSKKLLLALDASN